MAEPICAFHFYPLYRFSRGAPPGAGPEIAHEGTHDVGGRTQVQSVHAHSPQRLKDELFLALCWPSSTEH